MKQFEKELMRRSPLAAAVLEAADHLFDSTMLDSIYDAHRGRCYEDKLGFGTFLRLTREALIGHGGSAHKLFLELEHKGQNPIDESNFYRKLANPPTAVSRALLLEGTQRLLEIMPAGLGQVSGTDSGPIPGLASGQAAAEVPTCFDPFEVVIIDGKKVRNAEHRLGPTRGHKGKLLGATAVVALDARRGLVLAMNDSQDGMTNDVPLVPGLMDQLREVIHRPILSVSDRQYDNLKTMEVLSAREGDAFVVRVKKTFGFTTESSTIAFDSQCRMIRDETGVAFAGKKQIRVRRITLFRAGEEDVVVVTNLLDSNAYSGIDIAELYRLRWSIEQVFQQVVETFGLQDLIGSSPKAAVLQLSYCLLLYNLLQVVKAYGALDGGVANTLVSMYYLFDKTRKQLEAWATHTDGTWPRTPRTAAQMRQRLAELLEGSWNKTLAKAADKRPRSKPKPQYKLHGGFNSVQRVINGTARKVAL